LGELFTDYVSNNTLEGENYLIVQQLSRYLIKTFKAAQGGVEPVGNAKYLMNFAQKKAIPSNLTSPLDFRNPANQLAFFANRAGYLISQVCERMDKLVANGASFATAFRSVQWPAFRAARAHCFYTILFCFITNVDIIKKEDPKIGSVLKSLCDLFACYNIEKDLGEFLEASIISPNQGATIHEVVELLLKEVRPNAVPLVDAFNFTDRDLNSALGAYDGNVYERMFQWASKEKLNRTDVVACYDDYIKPILTKKWNSSKL